MIFVWIGQLLLPVVCATEPGLRRCAADDMRRSLLADQVLSLAVLSRMQVLDRVQQLSSDLISTVEAA